MSTWNVVQLGLFLWSCFGIWGLTLIDWDRVPRDKVTAGFVIYSLGPAVWLLAAILVIQEAPKRKKK